MNRFTILTLGCFSRNRYWGEEDAKSYRRALCTSTLIETPQGARILVDPAVSGAALAQVLDERCGLRPEAVDYVYVTHRHGDHYVGMADLPRAVWLAAPGDAGESRRARPQHADRIFDAGAEIVPGVQVLHRGQEQPLLRLLFDRPVDAVRIGAQDI